MFVNYKGGLDIGHVCPAPLCKTFRAPKNIFLGYLFKGSILKKSLKASALNFNHKGVHCVNFRKRGR